MVNDPEFEDIPSSAEAQEAEIIRLRNAQGPPLVSEELGDYIWDHLPREDPITWEQVAHASRNDRLLAQLYVEREVVKARQDHPGVTSDIRKKYEEEIRQIDERIAQREQMLDQARSN